MIAQTVFTVGLIAAASAGWESKTGSCNTGSIQCCKYESSMKWHYLIHYTGSLNEEKEVSTGKNDALISTGDIASQIGVQCDQVPLLIGVAIEDECKNTPVCCEDFDEEAAVGLGKFSVSCCVCCSHCLKAVTLSLSSKRRVCSQRRLHVRTRLLFIGHCCNYLLTPFVTLRNMFTSFDKCIVPFYH